MVHLGLLFAPALLSLPLILYLTLTKKSRLKGADYFMLAPAALVISVISYAVSFGEGCGSASPGPCFGLMFLMIAGPLPLALVLTPAVAIRQWRQWKPRAKAPERLANREQS